MVRCLEKGWPLKTIGNGVIIMGPIKWEPPGLAKMKFPDQFPAPLGLNQGQPKSK